MPDPSRESYISKRSSTPTPSDPCARCQIHRTSCSYPQSSSLNSATSSPWTESWHSSSPTRHSTIGFQHCRACETVRWTRALDTPSKGTAPRLIAIPCGSDASYASRYIRYLSSLPQAALRACVLRSTTADPRPKLLSSRNISAPGMLGVLPAWCGPNPAGGMNG